jgi:hypothetical protein
MSRLSPIGWAVLMDLALWVVIIEAAWWAGWI